MLTELDDCLWHQLPTTFDHVGTSDPRFFDRFWFAAYARDGSCALQFTMGVYRNMNVMDGGFVLVLGGQQYNVRVSRSLGQHNVVECGPLSIEVVQPLRSFTLRVEGADRVNAELHWTAVSKPVEEAPHFRRLNGRIVEDYQRFNQIGTVSGRLVVDGQEIIVEDWWACRDHSWGVRNGMAVPEVQTGPKDALDKRGFTMAFLFFSAPPLSGTLLLSHREGEPAYVSGELMDATTRKSLIVSNIVLKPDLHPGTRRFRSVEILSELTDGTTVAVQCEQSGNAIAMQGLGYSGGYNDRKGLGFWRGENVVEQDVWDVSHPADIAYPDDRKTAPHWHRIQPVKVSYINEETEFQGHGSLTLILAGSLPSLGLN
ncbi:hypothetical protein [Sphingobium sp. SA916]|uniref:hypothetical protein n=1 Tax=Sphingobium sp. SA916 TaxID=1851207 RepID=UPI000C9EFE68|nr:hypothetical protein [Sphingobium sp. SA916]PNQ03685.1 hypothetical protein A8G00_10680 [Sphingobium sp. SA916]